MSPVRDDVVYHEADATWVRLDATIHSLRASVEQATCLALHAELVFGSGEEDSSFLLPFPCVAALAG